MTNRLSKLGLALVAAAALLAPGGAAHADANFLGTTGQLYTPSAATVGDKGIGAHAFFHEDFENFGVLGGISDRFELGLNFFNPDGRDSGFLLNAKFAALKESLALPGIAVGVIDAFAQVNNDPSWYVVASKGFPDFLPVLGGARVHVGYGGGIFDNEPFASVELGLGTPLDLIPLPQLRPSFNFLAEYIARDVHLGIRGRYRGFAATVGVFDFEDLGGGVSYIARF